MYQQFGAELPFITRFVLGISNILTNFWWLIILLIVGGAIGFSQWKTTPNGKRVWDTYFIKVPIFGKLTRKVLVSNFARNLGVLLTNRVSLLTALTIVSNVVNHYIFQAEISQAIDKIKEGEKLSSAFQNSSVLPPMVLGMIAAGEISDTVPQMMNKLADIYDKEVDNTIKSMMQSLEPILLVVMGFVIFGIMAAIMTPMFKLTQEIQNL
jgi:general secretion pathway protein F